MSSTEENQISPSNRIASFQPYFFATLNKTIENLKRNNIDIIRLDMGSPDLPPADFICEKLVERVKDTQTHGYSPHGGSKEFRNAAATYYHNRFDVTLDPDSEICGLIGSKEGLFNFCQVLTNPGDINLVPDPGYPVYSASTQIAGGEIYRIPLTSSNRYLPELSKIPAKVLSKARILWLNYPNNPTGAAAPLSFLEEAVAFANQHRLIIGYDNPYADICFKDYQAPSILQVEGARNVSVEFLSFSKTYNMAGWRLGIAAGNSQIIHYLLTYKSQMDSSHFSPIMDAGATALTGEQSWIHERNQIYYRRQQRVISGLRDCGFEITTPDATIYVWAKLPTGCCDDIQYADRLIKETGVSVTPGSIYGEHGKNYIRISLCTPEERIQEAVQRLSKWTAQNFPI